MWFRCAPKAATSGSARTPAPKKRRRLGRRPLAVQLHVEALEDRCLPSFVAPVSYPVGAAPQAVVTADVNGDGQLDIITANAASNTVSVQLGNGNGTFQPAVNYATGTDPVAVAVGDLGNGKLDIVTANAASSTVSVLLGNGNGTFATAVNYATGSDPVSVAIGNFNGKPDIVTVSGTSGTVSVLLGNGDGTFQPAASYFVPGAASAVAVGDFNNDGKLDLAVTNSLPSTVSYYGYLIPGQNEVTVLLGNGTGGFTTGNSYNLPGTGSALAVADLTGNGNLDLVTANGSDNSVSVLLGNGNGTFQNPATYYGTTSDPVGLTLADVNGDGKPDIITANAGNNTVSVLLNYGSGNFEPGGSFAVGSSPSSVAAGDFNGNGLADLAVANSASNNVSVLQNTGSWPELQATLTDPVTGAPITSTTAGTAFDLTITALNTNGTVDTGYTGTVTLSSTDPSATFVDAATGQPLTGNSFTFSAADNGTHTFTVDLTTAGTQTLTASDPAAGGIVGNQPAITVNPAAASSFIVSGLYSPAAAGTPGSFTVTAEDPYGNVATGYTGTVTLSSTDPSATFADFATGNPLAGNSYTFTTGAAGDDYGSHTFLATLHTAGTQAITATDQTNSTVTGTQSGIQVLPAATISGPSAGYLNQPLTYTLGATGDPAGTVYTFAVNWGDGSAVQTVSGVSGTTVTHTYSTSVSTSISVTATDPNKLTSYPAYQHVYIAPVSVTAEADPAAAGQEMLVVSTIAPYNNSDNIALTGNSSSVDLTVNGAALGNIVPAGDNIALVVVYAGGSNDTINAQGLAVSSALVGGGNGDVLYGGSARNLLIAGPGTATLQAGSAGDILIGGTTSYDNNTTSDQTALAYIMAEWDSSASYSTRVGQLDGKLKTGLNGQYLLNSTTVSDNNAADLLYGDSLATGNTLDWYFAHLKGKRNVDRVINQVSGEVVSQI
jgi:hypothetical protein